MNKLKTLFRSGKISIKKLIAVVIAVLTFVGLIGILADTAAAQYDFCGSYSGEFQGFLDCETDFSSFTQYTGGLETVDPAEYEIDAPDNARDYVRNIVNFALGFLGFIALVIVIYGGFLYVTAAGDEDQTGKGVTAIKQAAIGIVIIFGSVAIVNTILLAPTDSERGLGNGGGTGGIRSGGNVAQVEGYDNASRQVQALAQSLVRSYSRYINQVVAIQKLSQYEVDKLTTRTELLTYFGQVKQQLSSLGNTQSSSIAGISRTAFAARFVVDAAIDPAIELVEDIIDEETTREEFASVYRNGLGKFFDDLRELGDDIAEGTIDAGKAIGDFFTSTEDDSGFNKRSEDINCYLPAEYRIANLEFDCVGDKGNNGEQNKNFGVNMVASLATLLDTIVIKQGINPDYDDVLENDIKRRLQDVEDSLFAFDSDENSNNSLITPEVRQAFEDVKLSIDSIKSANISYDINTIGSTFESNDFNSNKFNAALANNESMRTAIRNLNELHRLLKDIVFAKAVIRAHIAAGSAPLVVQFDCIQSVDPAQASITDQSCSWDLNGDGKFAQPTSSDFADCNEREGGTTVSCTYKKPGSYRVGLRVKSANSNLSANSNQSPIAAGLAYLTVEVREPVAKIDLKAKVNSQTFVLRSYDERGFIARDTEFLRATLAESQQGEGITFDASGTQQNSPDNEIVSYIWDFGDGATETFGANTPVVAHKYTRNGRFPVSLTVIDESGNQDRKLFQVVISSLAAYIEASPNRGDLKTEFLFDASRSRSDTGQVKKYTWSIPGVEREYPSVPKVKHTFAEPGSYNVSVQVQDAANNVDTATVNVLVESQAPKAFFTARAVKENQPSLITFDARQSFDPDPADTLSYRWRIYNAREGADYEIVDGKFEGDAEEAETVTVLFNKQQNYVVELTVSDQYEDERLRKETSLRADVNIQKLADIELDDDFEQAAILRDGEATVDFVYQSQFGETIVVDFGDGSKTNGLIANNTYRVRHTYKTAGLKKVMATVTDKRGDQTKLVSSVVIGEDNAIIPVATVKYDNVEYQISGNLPIFSRAQAITFDASKSLNTDGRAANLEYSWDFGDGQIAEGAIVSHSYQDLAPNPPGAYSVSVIVTSRDNSNVNERLTFPVKIGSLPPVIQSLSITALEPRDPSLVNNRPKPVTPFPVRVQALGAKDPDGEIREYRFYYFPVNNTGLKLGTKVVSEPEAILEVATLGVEGEENQFAFCVDITDDEGNTINCLDRFKPNELKTLNTVNGRNARPKVTLQVDRSNLLVGEDLVFSALAEDPDGEIVSFEWDIDGDGSFANDAPTRDNTFDHVYQKASGKDGYRVRVKVTDNQGATAISAPIAVFVDSNLRTPRAAFTAEEVRPGVIQFQNNSLADRERGGALTEYRWDANLEADSDGDGDATNDIDSREASPTLTYDRADNYEVKLTVIDNEGNSGEVTRPVIVTQSALSVVQGATTNLKAVLRTKPAIDPQTNTIYVDGETANITFYFDSNVGQITKLELDKNIYFDTNSGNPNTPGDGIRNNDVDHRVNGGTGAAWTTDFNSAWQPITVKLTAFDNKGNIHSATAEVVFNAKRPLGQASLSDIDTNLVGLWTLLALVVLSGVSLSVNSYYNRYEHKASKSGTRKLM